MDPLRGFISLARSFDESDIFQNEKWMKVFIWCLIQANYKKKNVPVKTGRSQTVVKVERGQFIFGRNKAAERLNMSPSTVRNIMDKLEVLESISIKKDSHYSIVTICNYDEYQDSEFYKGQATDNQGTGNGQPKDTTNKPNKPNNDNNKNTCSISDKFNLFYSAYPKKKSKGQAEKTFKKINPDDLLMTKILNGIKNAKNSSSWNDPQFIPNPSTWLNAKGWEDEHQNDKGPSIMEQARMAR